MSELLIKAVEPWNNDANTSKMSKDELQMFNSRSRKGDIIVVRPDGWNWGKCECLPDFIVVKVDGKEEDFKYLEQPLTDDTIPEKSVMLKVRKYSIPTSEVEATALEVKDFEKIIPISLEVNKISAKVA